MRVRPALLGLPLLVPLLLAGCASPPIETRSPVVVVTHDVSWTAEGAGAADAWFGMGCRVADYDADPLAVTLYVPPDWRHRPDFVVLHDMAPSWRRVAGPDAPPVQPLFAGMGGSSGLLERLFGDQVDTRGSSLHGTPGPFMRHVEALPPVGWRDGAAWLGDERLEEGRTATRVVAYDVPTDEGGTLHVTHRLAATYLGRVVVDVREQTQACRGESVRVGPALQPLDPA